MKKLLLIIVTIWISTNSYIVYGQCGSITLLTQQEIDNYSINHPNCTEIHGDLIIGDCIEPYTDSDITNLNGLSHLTKITSRFRIYNNPNLTSLSGMQSLNRVINRIEIYNNDALLDLRGLDNITETYGNIKIEKNNSLVNLSGLNNLTFVGTGSNQASIFITENDALENVDDLEKINYISTFLSIIDNPSLKHLDHFDDLSFIGGGLYIQ